MNSDLSSKATVLQDQILTSSLALVLTDCSERLVEHSVTQPEED